MAVLTRTPYYTGDRLPTIIATITDDTGLPINLTGGTIQFALRGEYETTNLFKNAATIIAPTLGTVRYDPGSADTNTAVPGVYDAYWIVTLSGKDMHVPAGQVELRTGV